MRCTSIQMSRCGMTFSWACNGICNERTGSVHGERANFNFFQFSKFSKFSKFFKISKFSKNFRKIQKFSKFQKNSKIFKIVGRGAVQKLGERVVFGKSCPLRILLQNMASIQPRTSPCISKIFENFKNFQKFSKIFKI